MVLGHSLEKPALAFVDFAAAVEAECWVEVASEALDFEMEGR